MDFTFLDKCFLAIHLETWKRVNELLGRYGVGQGAVNPKVIVATGGNVELGGSQGGQWKQQQDGRGRE